MYPNLKNFYNLNLLSNKKIKKILIILSEDLKHRNKKIQILKENLRIKNKVKLIEKILTLINFPNLIKIVQLDKISLVDFVIQYKAINLIQTTFQAKD
jgi:hypothetical protein